MHVRASVSSLPPPNTPLPSPLPTPAEIRSSSLQSRRVGFETRSGRILRTCRKYRVTWMCAQDGVEQVYLVGGGCLLLLPLLLLLLSRPLPLRLPLLPLLLPLLLLVLLLRRHHHSLHQVQLARPAAIWLPVNWLRHHSTC